MQACNENIKAKFNWLHGGVKSAVQDLDGHGTFVTSLLLDYAPDANIYIAKVADREPASPRVIAKVRYRRKSFPPNTSLSIYEAKCLHLHRPSCMPLTFGKSI